MKAHAVAQFMQYKGPRESTNGDQIGNVVRTWVPTSRRLTFCNTAADKGIFFMATDPDVYTQAETDTSAPSDVKTQQLLAARSEGGFIYGNGGHAEGQDVYSAVGGTSVCNVPWSSVHLITQSS